MIFYISISVYSFCIISVVFMFAGFYIENLKMLKNNGKLILKVKKKRPSLPADKFINIADDCKENVGDKSFGKRVNPFTNPKNHTPKKIRKKSDEEISRNSFFNRRRSSSSSSNSKIISDNGLEVPLSLTCNNDVIISPKREEELKSKVTEIKYQGNIFPLNWSLIEKLKFISAEHFAPVKSNIKTIEESKGIRNFIENRESNRCFCENLYNWVFPHIPGLASYPLRKKITGTLIKDENNINLLSSNKLFHEALMREWRTNFQSLFGMLKTNHCPYFYFCSYQFTILFKSSYLGGDGSLGAVISPTTKGLRNMLLEEGVPFDFPYCDKSSLSESTEPLLSSGDGDESDEMRDLETSLNDSANNEQFLDSIGLDKKTHFPNMLEHQRLIETSKSKKFDQGITSTIRVKECQSLFNFLLNSKFLCAPSGNMFGIPPTLISPSPFQGASLNRLKFSYADVRVLCDSTYQNKHCLEISGPMLPGQLIGILHSLSVGSHEKVHMQGKLYSSTTAVSIPGKPVHLSDEQIDTAGLTYDHIKFFNQDITQLPLNFDINCTNGCYTLV